MISSSVGKTLDTEDITGIIGTCKVFRCGLTYDPATIFIEYESDSANGQRATNIHCKKIRVRRETLGPKVTHTINVRMIPH